MRTWSAADPSRLKSATSLKVYLHLHAGQGPRRVAHLLKTLALAGAFLYLLVPLTSAGSARFGFPVIRGPYLGERAPRDRAELFSPGVISTRNHEYSPLAIRADGREMFWVVVTFDSANRVLERRVWHTREAEGIWSEPAPFEALPAGAHCPVLSPNGKELYFLSGEPDSTATDKPAPSQPWVMRASGDLWTGIAPAPNLLPRFRNRGTMSFSFASNGNLYFDLGGPDEGGTWRFRIYCSEMRNGVRREPRLLGDGINDGSINASPCISPDESYLIFGSNRDGGQRDLYISFRTRGGRWTAPVNMGPRVNTSSDEWHPSISADGRYLFFSRFNDRTLQDYYWIDARIVQDLRLECALNEPKRGRPDSHRKG